MLGEAISRKQTTLMALTSIVEVKVETALISEDAQNNGYLVALICFIIICLFAAVAATYLYLRQRRKNLGLSGINLTPSTEQCHRNHEDEKNNLQNEENLRRYANPLKDDVITGVNSGGVVGGSSSMTSINSAAATAANSVVNGTIDIQKVAAVRPLSALLPHETTSEMLEMISDSDCQNSRKATTVGGGGGASSVTGPGQMNAANLSVVTTSPGTSTTINDHHRHHYHHSNHNHHQHHHAGGGTLKMNENLNLTQDNLKPAHRNSQIMLYKAQNPDVRKNTVAAFDDTTTHKDFNKSVINVNKQRTSNTLPQQQQQQQTVQQSATQQPQQPQQNTNGNDVLTVLV